MRTLHFYIYRIVICIILGMGPRISNAQFNVFDSLALLAFYNATNGPNWVHQDNWLTGPVSTWYGINWMLPNENRVNDIILINNNLTGFINMEFFGLDSLYYLYVPYNNITGPLSPNIANLHRLQAVALNGNHITSLPESMGAMMNLKVVILRDNDLTGSFPDTLLKKVGLNFTYDIDSNHFTSIPFVSSFIGGLKCRMNNLTFEDIIPYVQNNLDGFDYYPQDSICVGFDTIVDEGESIVLDSWCGGDGNQYHWKKGASWVSPVDTNSTLTLNNIQPNQSGYYTCEVKNDAAYFLKLYRKKIHVIVNPASSSGQTQPQRENTQIRYFTDSRLLQLDLNFQNKFNVKAALFDIMGKRILNLYNFPNVSTAQLNYYLTWVKPGVYVVVLQYNNNLVTKKILVQ